MTQPLVIQDDEKPLFNSDLEQESLPNPLVPALDTEDYNEDPHLENF